MASSENEDQLEATFYIGQHEPRRSYPVTDEVLRYAQDECNYDMLTAPITTSAFHSRVLLALSPYLDADDQAPVAAPRNNHLPSLTLTSLSPADSTIVPGNKISQFILTTSPWIDLASTDPLIADVSRQILNLEVQYAAFCGATNVMVCGPSMRQGQQQPDRLSQYARAIREALKLGPFIQFHLLLPMSGRDQIDAVEDVGDLARFARQEFKSRMTIGNGPDADIFDSWDFWNTTRTVCKYSARLSVAYSEPPFGLALSIPRHLPPRALSSRWYSEPLRILYISGNAFYENSRGEAALSQQQKQLVSQYMQLRNPPWILLSQVGSMKGFHGTDGFSAAVEDLASAAGENRTKGAPSARSNPTPAEASEMQIRAPQKRSGIGSHLKYLRNLQHKLPPKSTMERFGAGYQDYLQSPLQPLSDNLESITYEVFEKDPVKYDWYELAITLALQEWQARRNTSSGLDGRVVLAVVGAGRGPLVKRALQASANSGVEIDLWAVEKNTNAFVLLQRHNAEVWNHKVNLVQSDMRSWTGPFFYATSGSSPQGSRSAANIVRFHVDILVSELLGSFGDNELSPECIDGVQRLLNPDHGISIPSSYTAYLTPIAAPKLHADILIRAASGDSDASQIPYVVMLQAIDMLATNPQPISPNRHIDRIETSQHLDATPSILKAWEFSHPVRTLGTSPTLMSSQANEHNRRFAQLDFHCKDRGVCHGLGGYFEAVLYEPESKGSPLLHSTSKTESYPSEKLPRVGSNPKVELSTNPLTMQEKSKDMISWFPIFFPFQVPLYFPDNSLLSISIWRQTNGRVTWYEWMAEAFMLLEVAPDGTQKLERLGTTDLHSSFANACQL